MRTKPTIQSISKANKGKPPRQLNALTKHIYEHEKSLLSQMAVSDYNLYKFSLKPPRPVARPTASAVAPATPVVPRSTERLGNLQYGIEDILNHELFASIDRNEFLNQKLPAPWIPNIKDPLDASNTVNKFAGLEKKKEIFLRKISAKDQEVFSSF